MLPRERQMFVKKAGTSLVQEKRSLGSRPLTADGQRRCRLPHTALKDDGFCGKLRLLSRKRIMLTGANFDTDTGKLSNWKNEELVRTRA